MSSNCIASASIGCLFCCHRCDLEKIIVAFTFLPPQPSYYVQGLNGSVCTKETGNRGKIAYLAEALQHIDFYQQAAEHAEVCFVRTRRGEQCPVVWLRPRGPSFSPAQSNDRKPLVLLHCHGNATDIGMMMGPYLEMVKQLNIEVVGVEYSGYGVSTGAPNPSQTYDNVEAAYEHIVAQGVSPDRIVAYGQSVGSGPAAYIASKYQIGGLVLHSPLMSGIKVIDPQPNSCCRPSCVFSCCDFYPTDKRLTKATSPTFIIHGQLDDIVPFYHGARLSDMTPKKYRWPGYFPDKAGHNDIVESSAMAYFRKLAQFLANVAQTAGAYIPTLEKPLQVEMQPASMAMGAQVVGARGDTDAWEDGLGEALPFAEPTVGPEDGMYNGLRREKPGKKTGL